MSKSKYVTLESADGFVFVVEREAAYVSGTLRGILESNSGFIEAESNHVKLPKITGLLLETVIDYFYFNLKYRDRTNVPSFDIRPDIALELLMIADYLDDQGLQMKITPKISVPLKGMADSDWVAPLKIYFSTTYGSADAYVDDINTLNQLRQNSRGAACDASGRAALFRYYKQLELLELRVPVNETSCRINFTWQDACSKSPTTQHSLAYEKASLLFNIAAVNSHIATESEDLKASYKAFQQSSGLYQFIFDKFLHAPSTDLTQETVKALSKLMLAQGQEAFVETLILNEASKPSLVSKLAKGTSKMYETAAELLQAIFTEKAWGQKAWHQYATIKSKYYQAVSHHLQSKACENSSKYGEAIAHLRVALAELQELATCVVPTAYAKFSDDIANLTKTVEEEVATLEKDNDYIYHNDIPNTSSIGEVSSMEAAKPIPYSEQIKEEESLFSEKELFKTAIPMAIHRQTSLYSEEKAKLLRAEDEKIEIADEEMASALEFLKLPGELRSIKEDLSGSSADILSLGHAQNIDPQVNDWASKVSASLPVETAISDLETQKRSVYKNVKEVEAILHTEEREYAENERQYKHKWTQAPSSVMNSGLYDDVTRIKGDLANSSKADELVFQSIQAQKKYLDILRAGPTNPKLLESFQATESPDSSSSGPSLLDLDTSPDSNLLGLIDDCESLIQMLNTLKKERQASFADFKQVVHEDDISTILVLNQRRPDAEENVFKEELSKFQPYITRFEQMKERQKDLLKQITLLWKQILESPAVQTKKKSRDNTSGKREALVEKYRAAYAAWKDFETGVQNGRQYYHRLSDFASSTLANAKDLVSNRREEAAKIGNSLEGSVAQNSQDLLREQLAKLSVASDQSSYGKQSYAPSYMQSYTPSTQAPPVQAPSAARSVVAPVQSSASQPSTPQATSGGSQWDLSLFDKPPVPPKPQQQQQQSSVPQYAQPYIPPQQQPQQQQQQQQNYASQQPQYTPPVHQYTPQQQPLQQQYTPQQQPLQQQYTPQYAPQQQPPQQQQYTPQYTPQQYGNPQQPQYQQQQYQQQQSYAPPVQGYAPQQQPQYGQQYPASGQKDYSSLPPPPPPPSNNYRRF
ncbi:uncharacterized protein SAPINGB_P005237 [Magnusiomyces paraingens]|uniref:Elongin-C n=1 Tax=Magnusiomyces paraingens TaxID=2606893 RepID=A0A5E8C1B6_9ASCO|nr:uncharacterized protein SAPINGB_P005237 [Saprochaete ingens]VVT56730.1 unnamed protein product [Saprochaete ingens]